MWPFSSSQDKNHKDLVKELPPELGEFYDSVRPELGKRSVFDASPEQELVDKVLVREQLKRQHQPYNFEFEQYKRTESISKVASINCAEIQQAISDCFANWKITTMDPCTAQVARAKACIAQQKDAFKTLHYNDCYSVEQCNKIRYAIDKAYIDSHGQYGIVDDADDAARQFQRNLRLAFYKVWK